MIYEVPKQYAELRDAVNAASGAAGDRTILISGKQRLTAPIELDQTVQGSNAGKLCICGADGDAALCGSISVKGFTDAGEYRGGRMFTLYLPQVKGTRHLYIDGVSMPRPRTEAILPNGWEQLKREDYFFLDHVKTVEPRAGVIREQYAAIGTTHTEILSWRNPSDVEMVFETGWTHCIVPLTGAEPTEDGKVRLIPEENSFVMCHTRASVPIGCCPNWFENVFEEIKPGEWYFDRTEHRLYLLLAADDTPEKHEIELPILEKLVTVKGSLDEKIRGITFEGLTFTGTTYMAPAVSGHAETQANMTQRAGETDRYGEPNFRKTPSAVCVRAAAQISFVGCTFSCLGSGGVDFEYGAEDCRAEHCVFADIAGSAVQIGSFNLTDAHPDDKRETVRAIAVSNCHIHDTGFDYRGSAAVIAGYVQDLSVVHNHIHHVPYSAVSVGWGWGRADLSAPFHLSYPLKEGFPQWTEPSVCKRNHIEYNHIHHVMQRLHDGGAVYTLGEMNGSTIIGNHIHDSAGYTGDGYPGMFVSGKGVTSDPKGEPFLKHQGFPGGIYMDEGSAGIEVSGNVLYHITVPVFYHNQIPDGWKKIAYGANTFNVLPEEDAEIGKTVRFAGDSLI